MKNLYGWGWGLVGYEKQFSPPLFLSSLQSSVSTQISLASSRTHFWKLQPTSSDSDGDDVKRL